MKSGEVKINDVLFYGGSRPSLFIIYFILKKTDEYIYFKSFICTSHGKYLRVENKRMLFKEWDESYGYYPAGTIATKEEIGSVVKHIFENNISRVEYEVFFKWTVHMVNKCSCGEWEW